MSSEVDAPTESDIIDQEIEALKEQGWSLKSRAHSNKTQLNASNINSRRIAQVPQDRNFNYPLGTFDPSSLKIEQRLLVSKAFRPPQSPQPVRKAKGSYATKSLPLM